MLYTTYISNIKNIPDGIEKRLVIRLLPPKFDLAKYPELLHTPELSPSKSLLLQSKENGDWNFFRIRFAREMMQREDLREAMQHFLKRLRAGDDICFICYEKDCYCHRFLLAKWFEDQGIEWKEL